ncbi:N-alpha-acetyltransferase 25, NatB auxiliary subunit [Lamellibrachia satsuma]|nr:N-alpha-acetyltransferase 25, NatB auxiliary subunit [Lamellibrachia satsuma]
MASRGGVDVSERRLRPIYDCLDNGNNKKALQEADKVLKKQKNFSCAKVLKGLALLRLGRQEDCVSMIEEVHDQHPTDEQTLQAMTICYKELNELRSIADMYENAHKVKPDNEEILSSLFMSYVRVSDYKKQQQTAMILHRLRPLKNPYYFWAIMSIVMQSHDADQKLAKTMFLPLAERMVIKYVQDGKVEAEAEVQIYLIILELLGKSEESLKVIQGELGDRLSSELDYRQLRCAELLHDLQRWPEVNHAYKKLLQKTPDAWNYYVEYIKSLFMLIDQQWTPEDTTRSINAKTEDTKAEGTNITAEDAEREGKEDAEREGKEEAEREGKEEGQKEGKKKEQKEEATSNKEEEMVAVDYTVDMAHNFLLEQVKLATESVRPVRGPYLARLEMIWLLKQRGCVVDDCNGAGGAMIQLKKYFEDFSSRACCFSDMRKYLALLDEQERQEFVKTLRDDGGYDKTEEGSITFATDVRSLQRHLTLIQLERHVGLHDGLPCDAKVALVIDSVARYRDGLKFGDKLLETDFQPSDTYLLFAVHTLLDIWHDTDNDAAVWEAIVLLEAGLVKCPADFQFKLLLVKLYIILGAVGPCAAIYESLEVKHIQHDSLSYIISNHVSCLGHLSTAVSFYDGMLKFFTVSHREMTECLISSYKYGSFTKIDEFVKFRQRLQNSLQYATATVERMLLDLILETHSHQNTLQVVHCLDVDLVNDKTPWGDLRDNRDMDVMQSWEPPGRALTEELKEQSFREEKTWLKLRNLTLRCLVAAAMISTPHATSNGSTEGSTTTNNDSNNNNVPEILRGLMSQLGDFVFEIQEEYAPVKQYPLTGPSTTRLSAYLRLRIPRLLLDLLELVLYVHKLVGEGLDKTDEKKEEMFTSVESSLLGLQEESLNEPPQSQDRFYNHKLRHVEVLEGLVTTTETLSHAVLLVGVFHALLKPIKAAMTKRGKKKKETVQPPPATFEHVSAMVSTLEKCLESLHVALSEQLQSDSLATRLDHLKLTDEPLLMDPEAEESLRKKMSQIFVVPGEELRALTQHKLQYLNTLKL